VGEIGRQLLRVDRDGLVADLVRAYADEWFAHYNFQFVANVLRGRRAPDVLVFLRRRTAEAFRCLAAAVHNEETIERLIGDAAPSMDGR
jgi:ferritin-like protein